MHQVYDDETTFKLVVAASQVSGLPVEVCLEEFGKHFLVYCQKNGYDQILRVLGSNLYDFLTNLDNLHDHLASIYPGMRAPSFRVTRSLGPNGTDTHMNQVAAAAAEARQQQEGNNNNNSSFPNNDNESHHSLASGSMYLHYYSERKGLSPIVKGLVLAVAREFFSTDITVTECKLARPQIGHADDHVVLKIDRRSQADILLDAETSEALAATAAAAAAADVGTQQVGAGSAGPLSPAATPTATPTASPEPTNTLPTDAPTIATTINKSKDAAAAKPAATAARCPQSPRQPDRTNSIQTDNPTSTSTTTTNINRQKTALSSMYGDTLSKLASDSLINSEIMMQTFPFHVIFDRNFKLVQVGSSLLRVTSLYWQRRAKCREQGDNSVKFDDLFSIVRPKIEFTFDAIADHTNQVFVVKTRPLVLNADYLRSSSSSLCTNKQDKAIEATTARGRASIVPEATPMCPMDRLAFKRRSCSAANKDATPSERISSEHEATPIPSEQISVAAAAAAAAKPEQVTTKTTGAPHHASPNDASNETSSGNHLPSLRLKGQMIILSGHTAAAQDSAAAGPFCLYLCSPRVDHLDQLTECGVRMSDLALHDRARELMLMSHTHKEDRETVKKLDQATNDLKKMDTKLRQENKRTNEVLHNIFPAKIATLLSHGVKIESESFDPVTCLYSDIIGFTKMCGSENVRPIDIVRLLNTLYLQFDNLTNIHGVYKVETIGDAYVIVGGLPEPVEDHADRCVRMGLDMVKVIATVRSPADNQPIQMRIGIHSGPVMAGIVGIRVPRFSLFGNTTTLANQLETHGQGGKIHISDFTLKNLIKRDKFVIEDNPSQIPGFPFKTHFVTNYLSDRVELLEHEKILEEQLLRDFELLGNEVELVDDNNSRIQQQQPIEQHQAAGGTCPVATSAAVSRRHSEHSVKLGAQNQQQIDTQKQQARAARVAATRGSSRDNQEEQLQQQRQRPIVLMDVEEVDRTYKGAQSDTMMMQPQQQQQQHQQQQLMLQARKSGRRMSSEIGAPDGNLSAEAVPRATRPKREQKRKMPSGELVEMSIKLSDEILSEAIAQYADLHTLDRMLELFVRHRQSGGSSVGAGFSRLFGARHKQPGHPRQPATDTNNNYLGLYKAASGGGGGDQTAAGGETAAPEKGREEEGAPEPTGSSRAGPQIRQGQGKPDDGRAAATSNCPMCQGVGKLSMDADEQSAIKLISAAVSVALASIGSIKNQGTTSTAATATTTTTTNRTGVTGAEGEPREWRFNRFLDHLINSRSFLQQQKMLTTTTASIGNKANGSSVESGAMQARSRDKQQGSSLASGAPVASGAGTAAAGSCCTGKELHMGAKHNEPKTATTTVGVRPQLPPPETGRAETAAGASSLSGSSAQDADDPLSAGAPDARLLRAGADQKTMAAPSAEAPPPRADRGERPAGESNAQAACAVDGLGQLLANLRKERERLSYQVARLELRLSELEQISGSGGGGGAKTLPESGGAPPTPSRGVCEHHSTGSQQGVSIRDTATTRSLISIKTAESSHTIQRMKRMDTLKRRKMKKEEQQRQQLQTSGGGGGGGGPHTSLPATPCALREPYEFAHCGAAQQVSRPGSTRSHQERRPPPVTGQGLRTSAGTPSGGGGALIESDSEVEVGDDDDDDDDGGGGGGGAKEQVLAPGGERANESDNPTRATAESKRAQPPKAAAAHELYRSLRTSLASLLTESPQAQLQEKVQVDDRRPQPSITSQQRPQQDAAEKKKRFSLSAFGTSFSAAIGSPFASPKKSPLILKHPHASDQATSADSGNRRDQVKCQTGGSRSQSTSGSAAGNTNLVSLASASARTTTTAGSGSPGQAQASGASGASAPGGGSRASGKQQQQAAATSPQPPSVNNCSCLKSSGSSQSIESQR